MSEILKKNDIQNGVKRFRIRSYSGPHFSRNFPHSDWIWRDTPYLSVFGPNARKSGKNVDQNNSEYGLFSRSAKHSCGIQMQSEPYALLQSLYHLNLIIIPSTCLFCWNCSKVLSIWRLSRTCQILTLWCIKRSWYSKG